MDDSFLFTLTGTVCQQGVFRGLHLGDFW